MLKQESANLKRFHFRMEIHNEMNINAPVTKHLLTRLSDFCSSKERRTEIYLL